MLGILNFLMKYADDFNLLVPENSDVPVEDEMKQIISWSNLINFPSIWLNVKNWFSGDLA